MASSTDAALQRLLRALRIHLGLDVAFVSQFRGADRVFRYVDTDLDDCPVEIGRCDPVEESYCHHVVRGDLPEILIDPATHPVARDLAVAGHPPAGTHLVVPIRLSDGSLYGALCCLGLGVHDALATRDLAVMQMMAGVVGHYLEEHGQRHGEHQRRRERFNAIRGGHDLLMVFQPIVRLDDSGIVGLEALARFPTFDEGPARVFAEARARGVGTELELRAVRAALEYVPLLSDGVYLSVNVSPTTLTEPDFLDAVRASAPGRLVVEITEHAVVHDYDHLLAAVARLTDLGVRLAVDDVGMGISGLHHILRLSPDIIKIDAALVRDIHASTAQQAMISALTTFAARMNIAVVAEGIETMSELQALRVLGVVYGQGYLLSRPAERLETHGVALSGSGRGQGLESSS